MWSCIFHCIHAYTYLLIGMCLLEYTEYNTRMMVQCLGFKEQCLIYYIGLIEAARYPTCLLETHACVDSQRVTNLCTSEHGDIRESVDSLCRDGADTPIVRVHTKALLTLKRSFSRHFRVPSYPIPVFVYPTIPPK